MLIIMLIISNKTVYAEESLVENLDDIEIENIIEEELDKNIYYEIYNKNNIMSNNPIINGKVKNCNLIEIKIGEEKFIKNIENSKGEWREFSIEIPLSKVEVIEIEFSNEFDILKKENIKLGNEIEVLSEITNKSKIIKVKCKENIKNVYALINNIEYKGDYIDINNTFEITLPNLKDQTEIKFIGIDENNQKIEVIKKVKQIQSSDNKVSEEVKKYKNILNLKIIELNDKSSKIKGETLPNSEISIDINGIEYNTISNKKGYFEIDVFIKRKAGTKVIFKIVNSKYEDYEDEKIFIKYIQDKTAPKKPYITDIIRENDTYIKGKAESYSNIVVSIKTPTHYVKENFINVRNSPSIIGFNKIGRLLKGTNILVLSENKEWSKIEFKDSTAYVKTKEIEKIDESKEFIYKSQANYFGDYKVEIDKHKQGSRVRVKAEDKSKNSSKEIIRDIQK